LFVFANFSSDFHFMSRKCPAKLSEVPAALKMPVKH